MQINPVIAYLLSLIIFFSPELCRAGDKINDDTLVIVTDYLYSISLDDSQRKLAMP